MVQPHFRMARSTSKRTSLGSIEELVVDSFRTSRLWGRSAPRVGNAIRSRRGATRCQGGRRRNGRVRAPWGVDVQPIAPGARQRSREGTHSETSASAHRKIAAEVRPGCDSDQVGDPGDQVKTLHVVRADGIALGVQTAPGKREKCRLNRCINRCRQQSSAGDLSDEKRCTRDEARRQQFVADVHIPGCSGLAPAKERSPTSNPS